MVSEMIRGLELLGNRRDVKLWRDDVRLISDLKIEYIIIIYLKCECIQNANSAMAKTGKWLRNFFRSGN